MECHHSRINVPVLPLGHGLLDVQGAAAGRSEVAEKPPDTPQVSENPVHHIWGTAIFCVGLIFCFGPLGHGYILGWFQIGFFHVLSKTFKNHLDIHLHM